MYKADFRDSRACERELERYLQSNYDDVILAPDNVALAWDLKVPSQDLVFEVKLDRYAGVKSSNIAVEVSCRNKPSGLSVSEANWWVYFIQDKALTIRVEDLRALIAGKRTIFGGDDKATELVLLPISEFLTKACIVPIEAA